MALTGVSPEDFTHGTVRYGIFMWKMLRFSQKLCGFCCTGAPGSELAVSSACALD